MYESKNIKNPEAKAETNADNLSLTALENVDFDNIVNEEGTTETKKYTSLSRELMVWFLLLSLLPLLIVSWISYQQANTSLTDSAIHKLEQSAALNKSFINNWFQYRLMDINHQAENQRNVQFLSTLREGRKSHKGSLKEFVGSYKWASLVNGAQDDILAISRRYDYIYNLYLIDDKGDLLYAANRESDLGTNLLTGPQKESKFSHAIKRTIETGETVFSDLEYYQPSGNVISGFFTSSLLNEAGEKLGVLAIQIRIDRLIKMLQQRTTDNQSLIHYIVGDDGKLRTTMAGDSEDILKRTIDTEQFLFWKAEHTMTDVLVETEEEGAFIYQGPNKASVFGIHNNLHLSNVHWVLISEIDENEALKSARWLGNITLFLVFITAVIVLLISIYQTRKISRPINQLVKASQLVAAGEMNQKVSIAANNEIGQLADAFNHMLTMRQIHESLLEETHHQAQVVLQELNEQRFALDQHAIVAVTNIKGDITFVNEKFSDISGYSTEELIGKNHRILNSGYHEKSFFIDMYQTISQGKVWHGEVCNRAKNGKLYWVDTSVVPFMGENDKPSSYIAIRTDITNRKISEAELINAKEAAEAATRLKSDFLANMSHEIRTPMNGVIGMTGLLLGTTLKSKQRSYAENTMKSAEALLTIINDILDFSKIEAGKLELEKVPFDLRALAEDVAEMMALKCRDKNVEMLLRYNPTSQYLLLGDSGRVRQILLNLLSNAIKFTEDGSVVLSIETYSILDNVVTVLVKIADTGIGIEQDKLDKIFNKFDQEDGSTTRKFGGTGLGLAICRQLCNLMEGDIIVNSVKGKGSVFSFTMNLDVSEDSNHVLPEIGDAEKLIGLKTLIIDDLEIANTILVEQLSELKLNIDTARSGVDGLAMMKRAIDDNRPYDIVFTDYRMPIMDGKELATEIQRQALLENGVLIFITSCPIKGDGEKLKKIGVDAYLTKPTHPSEVPQLLSLTWHAKRDGKNIHLITRHTLQEKKTGTRKKLKFIDASLLLVEDNPINQMVATEYLEGYGCAITPAGNGIEALAQIENNQFDLIFMDCQMPEMDGFEATDEIRKKEKDENKDHRTPIIAFTANAMQGDKEKCLAAGMDDFISKPISQKALEDILSKWLPHKIDKTPEFIDSQASEFIEDEGNESVDHSIENHENCFNLKAFNTLQLLFKDEFGNAVNKHINNAKENVVLIHGAIEKSDFEILARAAHSIKGSAAQFGAIALSQAGSDIEGFAKAGDLEGVKNNYLALKDAQENIADIMREQLKKS